MAALSPVPVDAEAARQVALQRYRILDSLPERDYDDIARIAGAVCGTPVALVSLVDADRQWFKARIGLDIDQTPRRVSFCDHAIRRPGVVTVVPDARLDPRFADNPLVTGPPHIRFYAGSPLVTPDGHALGTLCVIDQQPRQLAPSQLDALEALSRQTMRLLELREANLVLQRLVAERDLTARKLLSYQRELQAENAGLAEEASRDALTGLLNRSGLDRFRASPEAQAWAGSGTFCVAVLDLDHFKRINDSLGHAAGDEALRITGEEIRRGVRGGDVAVRYGGEEFLLLMPSTPLPGAVTVVERIRRGLAGRTDLPTTVTLSAGLAAGLAGRDDPEAVFRAADQALYRAKRAGRDRIEISED